MEDTMTNTLRTIISVSFFVSITAHGWDSNRCKALLNDGLFKKYDYAGLDISYASADASHKDGTTKGSFHVTGEQTTTTFDPKFWVHESSSIGGFTTSTGPCKAIGLNEIRQQRELYFAQNKTEIFKEIAKGRGEHLRVLSGYSLCEDSAVDHFSETIQSRMKEFIETPETRPYGIIIDDAIKQDESLKASCYSLT
jgi:hypothetical protein